MLVVHFDRVSWMVYIRLETHIQCSGSFIIELPPPILEEKKTQTNKQTKNGRKNPAY